MAIDTKNCWASRSQGVRFLLRRVIGEDIQLSVVTRNADLRLRADPDQLEQVIMNLVVNARDGVPSRGKLTIETAELTVDEEYCSRNPETKPGDYVMIAVTDTGCAWIGKLLREFSIRFFYSQGTT